MNQIIFSFGSVIKIFKIASWLCEYDEAIILEEKRGIPNESNEIHKCDALLNEISKMNFNAIFTDRSSENKRWLSQNT